MWLRYNIGDLASAAFLPMKNNFKFTELTEEIEEVDEVTVFFMAALSAEPGSSLSSNTSRKTPLSIMMDGAKTRQA